MNASALLLDPCSITRHRTAVRGWRGSWRPLVALQRSLLLLLLLTRGRAGAAARGGVVVVGSLLCCCRPPRWQEVCGSCICI
jgi:hypothetical protein